MLNGNRSIKLPMSTTKKIQPNLLENLLILFQLFKLLFSTNLIKIKPWKARIQMVSLSSSKTKSMRFLNRFGRKIYQKRNLKSIGAGTELIQGSLRTSSLTKVSIIKERLRKPTRMVMKSLKFWLKSLKMLMEKIG